MKPSFDQQTNNKGNSSEGRPGTHPVIWFACRILDSVSRLQPDISFAVDFPGFRRNFGREKPDFVVRFRNMKSVRRFLFSGGPGLGEDYVEGDIEVEGDFQSLIHVAAGPSLLTQGYAPAAALEAIRSRLGRMARGKAGQQDARGRHRFGNDFYRPWLDGNMSHSCGFYENADDDLETAQLNKYRNICRQLRLRRGETLLDVGCGWGGMMFYAADRFGARCTGFTLSQNQYDYVREEIRKRGYEGRVDVWLDDYRNAVGQFDRIVSMGMFENPGPRHDRAFFRKTRELLKPDGVGVLHIIGTGGDRRVNRLITRHVFPGGSPPTLEKITGGMARENLWVYDLEDLHVHCARTLDEWARRFDGAVQSLDLPERSVRMWRLYLNACAVGFKVGDLRIYRVTFTPEKSARIPLVKKYIYANPMPA